jgi:hypothetical protein
VQGDYNYYEDQGEDTLGQKKFKKMLNAVSNILENSGFVETVNKVFSLFKDIDHMPMVFFLLTMNAIAFMQYDVNIHSLTRRYKDKPIDGPPFIVGLLTVFKHFHPTNFTKFLLIISHYSKGAILMNQDSEKKQNRLPMDVALLFAVLDEVIRFGKFDRDIIKQLFGSSYIFDNFKLN